MVLRIQASGSESDGLWETVFNKAHNPDFLYLALTHTKDLEKRRKLLLRFVEHVVKHKFANDYLFNRCMLTNTDVILLIDALQESLMAKPNLS